jgi:hypothetical protein
VAVASRTWYCGIHWRQASHIAGLPTPRPAIPSRVDRARRRPVRGAGAAVSPRQRPAASFHAVHGAHDLAFHGFDRDAVALGQLGMRGALDAVGQEDVAAARGQLRQAPSTPARAWR